MSVVRFRFSSFLPLLALLVLVVGVAGCSFRSEPPDLDADPTQLVKGRDLFQSSCKVCHTLGDADANGVFGPNLDVLQPGYKRVRDEIDSGGGGMPAHILTGRDADLVAAYVAQVAGTSIDDAGAPSSTGEANASPTG